MQSCIFKHCAFVYMSSKAFHSNRIQHPFMQNMEAQPLGLALCPSMHFLPLLPPPHILLALGLHGVALL